MYSLKKSAYLRNIEGTLTPGTTKVSDYGVCGHQSCWMFMFGENHRCAHNHFTSIVLLSTFQRFQKYRMEAVKGLTVYDEIFDNVSFDSEATKERCMDRWS